MESLRKRWNEFAKKQTELVMARHSNARINLTRVVILLLILSYGIPKAAAGPAACAPCMGTATTFCAPLIAAGGACFSVAAFPPLLCACLLASGTGLCAWAIGACVPVCLAPTP